MSPNYVAKKSVCSVLSFGWLVSCIFILPIFVLIFRILAIKKYQIEFYDDKIITYSGLFNISKKQTVFMGVTATSLSQSVFGRMFNYGNVSVDCVGKWDVDTSYIKDPNGLVDYLETKIIKAPNTTQFIQV